MSISKRFIDRPVATSLIMAAILIAGLAAFMALPIASLPTVDFPTIVVSASLPGADPETMASSVASPLERQLSNITNVTQMTSTSSLGSTQIALQFTLDRNIDAAAQDVATAINAAAGLLPKNMPNPPNYRKTNPAEQNIMLLEAYSETLPIDEVNAYIDNVFVPQLASVPGVGDVYMPGAAKPAVRVQVDPAALANQGISLEDVRAALTAANVNAPTGSLNGPHQSGIISVNDQLDNAAAFQNVIIAYRNGAPVRISDIGTAIDSVENTRTIGWGPSGKRGVMVAMLRQPGANVIETVDRVKAKLPALMAGVPKAITINVIADRTHMIRSAVSDIEFTLMLTVVLVIAVIFFFLRKIWTTVIPGLAVPLSLFGAFVIMKLMGYSLDTLSLMALTIAVGFVVDDAIVMLENIVRHMEHGQSAYDAAVTGSREIGSTIVSMTFSLVAVFIPLLLMGGLVGRLFREFAVTVAVAVLISGMVSLVVTPSLCAQFLTRDKELHGRFYTWAANFLQRMLDGYAKLLRIALSHKGPVAISVLVTVVITGILFAMIPKGFFPLQDTGLARSSAQGAPDASFAEMTVKMRQVFDILSADPAVAEVQTYAGDAGPNSGRMNFDLKPFSERDPMDKVLARLRPQLNRIPGLDARLVSTQDINIGARQSRTQFQYTLEGQDIDELHHWADVMFDKMRALPGLEDLSTDQQTAGLRTHVNVDRDAAARLGVTLQQIDDTLYDAFGQRQVGTIFTQVNQRKVVLEIDPKAQTSPDALNKIYVKSASGQQVPLGALSTIEAATAPLFVSHQGQFPATTISFNLVRGVALGTAIEQVEQAERDAHMPPTITASFQGTAQAFQDSLTTMPLLIAAAIISVYIVLGILYESYIHPITILSTLPSAGVGALVILWVCGFALDMIGLIGILLLIGIVKKNAIMMVDFALEGERERGLNPEQAIYEAAVVRFRPIMMTTASALLAGIPLMIIGGAGSEFRRPLGFAIVGGLVFSQCLTLFTTPVVYLYMHKLADRFSRNRVRTVERIFNADGTAPLPGAAE